MPTIYYNPSHKYHSHNEMHPECPERIDAIMSRLEPMAAEKKLAIQTFTSDIPLFSEYDNSSWIMDDGDTYATPYTKDIQKISCTMIDKAVDDLLSGQTSCAFVLCRPPGHHASPKGPAGFCHMNNAWHAVQRLHANKKHSIGIYDWDVHHGDGTQNHIDSAVGEQYDSLRFVSTHVYGPGIYPHTGAYKKTQRVLNLPLRAGTTSEPFLTVFENDVLPFLGKPEVVIVSAGYDGHRNDPMDMHKLDTWAYKAMATRLQELDCPILFLLEGGYNPKALADSVVATLEPFIRA